MARPTTTATLHPRPQASSSSPSSRNDNNPLPPLLHTPAGLALLELQGTINLPDDDTSPNDDESQPNNLVNIGRLNFPDYRPDSLLFDPAGTAWMRRAYLYVGQHQRLTGEVKKLPKALGIVRRRQQRPEDSGVGEEGEEQLEMVEVVKYKIVFSSRPEPVGTAPG